MKTANRVVPPRNSAQPGISSTLKIYGGTKSTPTVRVRLKDSDREVVINPDSFDPEKHERIE